MKALRNTDDKVPMPYLCDGCGCEMEIWVGYENPQEDIDPPYFCEKCEEMELSESEYPEEEA